jgi:hypothetical protein
LEECDENLISGIFVTDEAYWAITLNKPIPGLQFSDASLVFVLDACTLVGALPAIVPPLDPTALLRL